MLNALNVKKIMLSRLVGMTCLICLNQSVFAANLNSPFDFKKGWARQTLQNNSNTAVYGVLSSKLDCEDVQLQSNIATTTEVHQMIMTDQNMKMQALKPFALKVNQAFDLFGPYHIMMMNVKQTLNSGQKIKITISCAKPVTAAQSFWVEVKSIKEINKMHRDNQSHTEHAH